MQGVRSPYGHTGAYSHDENANGVWTRPASWSSICFRRKEGKKMLDGMHGCESDHQVKKKKPQKASRLITNKKNPNLATDDD